MRAASLRFAIFGWLIPLIVRHGAQSNNNTMMVLLYMLLHQVGDDFATCCSWLVFLAMQMMQFCLLSHYLLPALVCFFGLYCFQYAVNMWKIELPSSWEFEALGFEMLGCKSKGSSKSKSRRFKAFFGAEPEIVAELWRELHESQWLFFAGVRGPKPAHLLWGLMFLRRYGTEETMAVLAGVSEKTFRKWAWFYATGIANLDKIFVSLKLSTADFLFVNSATEAHAAFFPPHSDCLAESSPFSQRRAGSGDHRWS